MAFQDIDLATYQRFSDAFDRSVFKVFDVRTALKARKATGAPSPAQGQTPDHPLEKTAACVASSPE